MGDILELSYGKALKGSDRDGGNVPVVGSGGIVGGHSTGITDSPTIVVGRKGSIGSVTWIDGPAWPIDTAYFVKPKRDDLDRRWAYWMLKSLRMETMNKSAAVPGLNRDDVYRLNVALPPLPEQRRIAAILDHVDALRARRSEQLAHLDALAQSIFISLFGDGSSSRSKTTIVCLEDVVERITYGFTNPMSHVSAGIPIVTAKSVRNQDIDLVGGAFTTRDEFNALTDKSRPRKGDVLITKDGTIGRCAVVDTTEPFCINQSVAVVRPRQDLRPRYLVGYLTLSRVQRLMNGMGKGNALKHLQITELAKFSIPVPAVEEQSRYESQMAIVNVHRAALRRSVVAGNELFESLESRAFRGEL
ncbi:restriction endonuclease subunit S [Nocardioides jensenii]|uniref:restriction endonuclease subunit S n=1 Tax=Nocardioides jensenii TaxID=1843 RepID=UPI0014703B59|nr:restriction endonuclease subunit S [Nocardioides jensenii]